MGCTPVLIGALAGLAGAVPGVLLARRARRGRRVSVAAGLAATLVSWGALTVVLGKGYEALGAGFLPMALACAGAFLGAWVVEACRAWRWIGR